eukprot:12923095-Prorocentrum_lima.AAC.1
MLVHSGVNLDKGFLSPTLEFRIAQYECHRRSQWIEDFYQLFYSISSVPPPIDPSGDAEGHFRLSPGGYDQRTG